MGPSVGFEMRLVAHFQQLFLSSDNPVFSFGGHRTSFQKLGLLLKK